MSEEFKDHFSSQAATYTQFRPHYPASLFAFLASQCRQTVAAWDCATGNGQAATGLAKHFECVIATDASAQQIEQSIESSRVEYRIATAEASGLDDHSVDLVTVAQAAHWFDHDAFAAEVQRVLRPGGVIALWAYELERVASDIDVVIDRLYDDILEGYWPPERRHIESGYTTIPFPFEQIETPPYTLEVDWTVEQQLGYFRSWSSSNRYLRKNGSDPVSLIEAELAAIWGNSVRRVTWPLVLKVGRVPG
ncbi:MAG: class I SAM-dependent methyltransferase [Pseudomonadota bacterium]